MLRILHQIFRTGVVTEPLPPITDPELEKKEHAGIRSVLSKRYSRALKLFRVG